MKTRSLKIAFGCLVVLSFFNIGASSCDGSQVGGSSFQDPSGANAVTGGSSTGQSGSAQSSNAWPDHLTGANGGSSGGTAAQAGSDANPGDFGGSCDQSNPCNAGLACTGGVCVTEGNLRFTLIWDADTDLDLYVRTPTGEELHYRNRNSADGGEYEGDACINSDCEAHDGNYVETIVWADVEPTEGTYEFWAENFNGERAADITFDVSVEGQRDQYNGSVGGQRGARSNTYALTLGARDQDPVACDEPAIVSRSDWGARAARRLKSTHTPRHFAIHHTVTDMGWQNAESQMRAIQHLHINGNGWADIGYHYVISGDGTIYEATPVERIGTHMYMENTGRIGVAFLGDFRYDQPSEGQLRSASQLIGWLAGVYGIDVYYNSASPGQGTIFGHGQYPSQSTECPGPNMRAQMQTLVDMVNACGN